jgi:LmbE family N-acetylglucosaminyl deacetylase
VRYDAGAPELLLSPHWDDAVLDCWGVLANGRPLAVVNVFAAIPATGRRTAWEEVIGAQDTAERARMRMAEDAAALARSGREAINLPLPGFEQRAARRLGLDDLDRELSGAIATTSRVYAPAAIGGHADHLLAREYARALRGAGMPVTLYADLPYCTFHGWPAWVSGQQPPQGRDVDAYWSFFLRNVPEMPPLRTAFIERLDVASAAAKAEAILSYEASLNYGVRHLLSDPAFHSFEVRWDLPSPGGDASGRASA